MSVIKKSFIKIAALMLGVTLVATACDFGSSSSTSETSQSSSSEVSTQTPVTSSDISSSTTSSNSQSSVSSTTSSSIIPTLTGISLNTDSVKKEYNYGETLNLAGLVVNASYSNNTTTQVTGYTTNPANGSELKTVGENDIVVTYQSFTASFKITVSKVLTGIELNAETVKKEYAYNENLDLTGLVVTAKYNDNSSAAVTDYTTNPANGAALTNLGENTVTVTYNEKTASFKINVVKTLTGIELDTANVKKEYNYGEALDLSGLVVTAKYNDNSTAAVTDYTTNPVNGATLTTAGENTVTVTYKEKTASFKIEVAKTLTGIDIDIDNVKTEYYYNDELDLSGLVVKAKYDDNSVETVTDYTTNPANGTVLKALGENTVTVTYGTFTKEFTITVGRKLINLKVEAKGAQKIFYQGDEYHPWGLYVTAFYNDGFVTSIGDYTTDPAIGTILDTVGKVTVTVSYQGFKDTYEITVEPALVPETGNKLVLDLSQELDFSISGLTAYVNARGTTPNSDYFQCFYFYKNSNAEGSMTTVNSKLRVMEGDVIRNSDSLHGVTSITVNGGNGNFRLFAGYTEDEMYEFLEAESNGGDRIYNNVPNVNYIKLVGKYDSHPADISSIEFTYTRDENNQPVDGVKSTVDLSNNQGTYTRGTNTIVIENNNVTFNGVVYTFTGIIYKQANLFFADANGNLLLVSLTSVNQIEVKDPINAYSSANGAYDKHIPATKITMKIDGVVTAANTADTRKEVAVGDKFDISATSDAYPVEAVNIKLVDETNGEPDAYVGTYSLKDTVTVRDVYGTVPEFETALNNIMPEFELKVNPIVVTKENGAYKVTYSDVGNEYYAGTSGTFDATVVNGKIDFSSGCLSITIDTSAEKLSFEYIDDEAYVMCMGDMSYNFASSSKVTAKLENGRVTVLNGGDFYLDCTTSNGIESKLYFHVPAYIPATLTVDTAPVTLKVDETHQINATIPVDATDDTILYESSDETVATVDENGLVKAVAAGEATITITTNDDETTITVTVEADVQANTVTYKFDDDTSSNNAYTLVVVEGVEATIEGQLHFTYKNNKYVYDGNEDVYFVIRISGSQAYLDFTTDYTYDVFGYLGPIYIYSGEMEGTIFLTEVVEETPAPVPTPDPQPVTTTLQFLLDDVDSATHTLVVVVGESAVIDDDYKFEFDGAKYVWEDDSYCYFTLHQNDGNYYIEYNDDNYQFFYYGVVNMYESAGIINLVLVD